LERVATVGAIRATFPFIVDHSWWFPLPIFKNALQHDLNMRNYAVQSLERYRHMMATEPSQLKQTLLANMFKAERAEGLPFNEIRDEAQSYITAGTDTTAISLTYLIWSICRHPNLQVKLVEELRKLPVDFTEAHLREIKLLNNIVKEAMRLYSAAPSTLPRAVPPGGVELAGYQFCEGVEVSSQAYSLHRDPAIFPDPDNFVPSRWESPTKAMKDSYMPFGRGPRGKPTGLRCVHVAQSTDDQQSVWAFISPRSSYGWQQPGFF
jgi:cytochrome P450